MKLETIKINHKDGYCLINKRDFDPDSHQEFLKEGRRGDSGGGFESTNTEVEVSEENFVDLNTASIKELATLPTVGRAKAKSIIENRPYESVGDAIALLDGVDALAISKLATVTMAEGLQ